MKFLPCNEEILRDLIISCSCDLKEIDCKPTEITCDDVDRIMDSWKKMYFSEKFEDKNE